jgi:phenylalanyl-tRNA synthetase beta chain
VFFIQVYKAVEPAGGSLKMYVEAPTSQIRPFVVCAVLRGVSFDKKRYKSFIDLQEKLHQNICRKRSYVAIGTHDLDTVEGPFRYKALAPSDINFVPLTDNDGRSFSGKELLDFYREDPTAKHLKPYTDLIYDSPVYPVIYDSKDRVLSMPPIINSKHSRIQMHTTNVFIECTGTDLTKANIVLDTVVTMFAEYCAAPFTAETVEVIYEETGKVEKTPLLSHRTCDAPMKDIVGIVGVDIPPAEVCKLCDRMQLGPADYLPEQDLIRVHVPSTRSDILHAVDVIEDVAIAFGYNNIPLELPPTRCFGRPLPINSFADLLRAEVARSGYIEMLTHGLCSTAENFTHLRRPVGPAVSLSNPANVSLSVEPLSMPAKLFPPFFAHDSIDNTIFF